MLTRCAQWVEGMKVWLPHLGHMTKMAAKPIYGLVYVCVEVLHPVNPVGSC